MVDLPTWGARLFQDDGRSLWALLGRVGAGGRIALGGRWPCADGGVLADMRMARRQLQRNGRMQVEAMQSLPYRQTGRA